MKLTRTMTILQAYILEQKTYEHKNKKVFKLYMK